MWSWDRQVHLWVRALAETEHRSCQEFLHWQYAKRCHMSIELGYLPFLTFGERTLVVSHWLLLWTLSCELLPWAYLNLFSWEELWLCKRELAGCLQSLVELNWGDLRNSLSGARSSQQLGWRKARTRDKWKPLFEASGRSLGSQWQREEQSSVNLVPCEVPDDWLHMVTLSVWGQSLLCPLVTNSITKLRNFKLFKITSEK